MAAAAHGKSSLGIPKKVGQEFLSADKGKKHRKPPKQFQLPRKSKF
jgi:hypothetical protein